MTANQLVKDSPVSNDGCGLKQIYERRGMTPSTDSPVSNDGCGLKLSNQEATRLAFQAIHPSAMTGVD